MNICILGGGVGGLSTAIALKQKGFNVEIYERHSKLSEIGAGIVCWPNACFILEKLGVINEIADVSGKLKAMNRFTNQGEAIGSLDITELNQLMGYSSYSIFRKDLMKILSQKVRSLKIPVHYQHNATRIQDIENSKTAVHFTDQQTVQADIVIGADGRMNSCARTFVHGNNTPIFQELINWIGIFETDEELFPELAVADYWGVGTRFGIVPVSKNRAYWAGGVVAKEKEPLNADLYVKELTSLFDLWPDPIPRMIRETPPSQINKVYLHDHEPITTWHRNNVILLGDCVHAALPTSGQGACQALEDAWHLSNCLAEHSDNIQQAFKQFTQVRLTKTTNVTASGRQIASSIFNTNPEFCKQRDITSKQTDFSNAVKGMANVWSTGLPLLD